MSSFKRIDDEFFIGPQPTDEDLAAAKQRGIKTVIDFRLPHEMATSNAALTASQGLAYVNIPTNKAALSTDQIDDLDRAIKDHAGPFLLHCATGARAALLLSLRKAKQHGWATEQTFCEAKRLGFDLKTSAEFSDFITKTVT
ncbi:beta-lactamase hydrolase domain-containing protein [Actimicrobium antarcticum]|uniref:Beta-lactamase hydrolase-like protein phosphatase-like domain-containing protein n=1 Tax=Actimicrobium antarcticum TaxID=1051899 RepID=A0ABP7SHS6_9BURK